MSGVGSRMISGAPSAFLSFCRGDLLRPEVGDGGGHDDHVGAAGAGQHRRFHLGGGLDLDDLDAGRCGQGRRC